MSQIDRTQDAGAGLGAGIRAILARTGKPRLLVRDEPIRNTMRAGMAGFELAIDLPSYRSLPLSCIEDVLLKVDGVAVERGRIRLVLNGYVHTLDELAGMSRVWWFILDPAHLFVESTPLAAGEHAVWADVVTVEPYVTAGRFSFHHPVERMLRVEAEEGERQ
jgi:hypothetical protein